MQLWWYVQVLAHSEAELNEFELRLDAVQAWLVQLEILISV